MNHDDYMFSYLDRRMNCIIDEWQLATKGDLLDLNLRYQLVKQDLIDMKSFERSTDKKLSDLEERVRILQRRKNDRT